MNDYDIIPPSFIIFKDNGEFILFPENDMYRQEIFNSTELLKWVLNEKI